MPDGADRWRRVCDVPWEHLLRHEFRTVIWPQLVPFIDAALKVDPLGRYRVQDILDYALCGRLRLWVSYDQDLRSFEMVGATEIVQFPACRVCHVWFVGGRNMKAWLGEILSMIEDYARAQGCDHMTSSGRRGWIRATRGWWREEPSSNLVRSL